MRNESILECTPYLVRFGDKKYGECLHNYTFVYTVRKGYEGPAILDNSLQPPQYEMSLNHWFNGLSYDLFRYLLPWVDITYDDNGEAKAIKQFSTKRHKHYLEDNPL